MSAPLELLKNQYKIDKEIGQGGFGKTYLAIDTKHSSNRLVVVKQFFPRNQDDTQIIDELKGWFDREGKILKKLGDTHRLIPQRYDSFEEDGYLYIIQEYIEGEDLSKIIKVGNILSEIDAIDIVKNILKPLKSIHGQGIIHRDIKPDNLRVREINKDEDEIIVIDFGIAIEAKDTVNLLTMFRRVGTPYYKSPEQSQGNPTFASDIYAVGMIGLQAITGKSAKDISFQQKDGTINPNSLQSNDGTIKPNAGVIASDKFIKFLNKALIYDPKKRFADATEALDYLDRPDTEGTSPTEYDNIPEGTEPGNVVAKGSKSTQPAVINPQEPLKTTFIGNNPTESIYTTKESGQIISKKPRRNVGTIIKSGLGLIVKAGLGAIATTGLGAAIGWWMTTREPEWKTTLIAKYGVQLSYPSNWTLESNEPDFRDDSIAILYRSEEKSECGDRVNIETRQTNSRPNLDELKSNAIDRIKKMNDKPDISDATTRLK